MPVFLAYFLTTLSSYPITINSNHTGLFAVSQTHYAYTLLQALISSITSPNMSLLQLPSFQLFKQKNCRLILVSSTSFTLYVHLHCHHPSLSHHHLLTVLPKWPPNWSPCIHSWPLHSEMITENEIVLVFLLNETTNGLPNQIWSPHNAC